jgi:hypothetical protein
MSLDTSVSPLDLQSCCDTMLGGIYSALGEEEAKEGRQRISKRVGKREAKETPGNNGTIEEIEGRQAF